MVMEFLMLILKLLSAGVVLIVLYSGLDLILRSEQRYFGKGIFRILKFQGQARVN